nr:hypothetical protein [Pandoravirus aubagnensis]
MRVIALFSLNVVFAQPSAHTDAIDSVASPRQNTDKRHAAYFFFLFRCLPARACDDRVIALFAFLGAPQQQRKKKGKTETTRTTQAGSARPHCCIAFPAARGSFFIREGKKTETLPGRG